MNATYAIQPGIAGGIQVVCVIDTYMHYNAVLHRQSTQFCKKEKQLFFHDNLKSKMDSKGITWLYLQSQLSSNSMNCVI